MKWKVMQWSLDDADVVQKVNTSLKIIRCSFEIIMFYNLIKEKTFFPFVKCCISTAKRHFLISTSTRSISRMMKLDKTNIKCIIKILLSRIMWIGTQICACWRCWWREDTLLSTAQANQLSTQLKQSRFLLMRPWFSS